MLLQRKATQKRKPEVIVLDDEEDEVALVRKVQKEISWNDKL
jgi:hypothetical protein